MKQKNIFISMGSNIGDPSENCLQALKRLEHQEDMNINRVSSLYQSPPWGKTGQPPFVNLVLEIETQLNPHQLLRCLQRQEKEMGRERKERWGPRIIDLDIIFFNQCIIATEDLTIPHPLADQRNFVLTPLKEIAQNFVHPLLSMTVSQLLKNCPDTSIVIKKDLL